MLLRTISIFIIFLWVSTGLFAGEQASVMVFAAASTTNVIKDAAQDFQKQQGTQVITSFAASSTLARQIEKGAPAEIYLSANLKWMQYLEDKGLIIANTKKVLFSNRLVLISPQKNPLKLTLDTETPLSGLLAGGYLAMANPDHTPVGMYAKQSLKTLGLWDAIETRIARTKDVRAALMLVERNESPLGIVYVTDAMISKRINVVGTFPLDSHPPIIYVSALISGDHSTETLAFFDFLYSEQASKIYRQYGFSTEVP